MTRDPLGTVKIVAIAAVALLGINRFLPGVPLALIPHRGVPRPDAHAEPIQVDREAPAVTVPRRFTTYRLTPRASYDISARVVARERFWLGVPAGLIPWDFGLAWGMLVDEPLRSRIAYFQTSRFLFWSWKEGSLDRDYIARHAANVHLIPATSRVAGVLNRVRTGDVVRMEGDLVDIAGPNGFTWATSLSRTDTGPGACETIWVRAITVGTRRYE